MQLRVSTAVDQSLSSRVVWETRSMARSWIPALRWLWSIGVTTRLRHCFIVTAVGEMHLRFSSARAPAPELSVTSPWLLVLRPTSAWRGGDHDGPARSWPTTSLRAAAPTEGVRSWLLSARRSAFHAGSTRSSRRFFWCQCARRITRCEAVQRAGDLGGFRGSG